MSGVDGMSVRATLVWLRGAQRIAIVVALAASTLAPANSLETSDLIGWWIALDDTPIGDQ
jgi:hypothetical protein